MSSASKQCLFILNLVGSGRSYVILLFLMAVVLAIDGVSLLVFQNPLELNGRGFASKRRGFGVFF